MRIKIRIYNPYDLDIIALTEAPSFSVANAMKQTLKYYAAGKRYLIEIPSLPEELKRKDQYVKGFYVELDDVADAQAVAFIKSIPDGLRNAFMKNIFRASFEVSPMSLYMGEGGAEYVANMIANPRYGRHPVQREIVDHVYLAEGEVSATLSDTPPDISKLPHGNKVKKKKVKVEESENPIEALRDVTKQVFSNTQAKIAKEKEQRASILSNATISESESNAMDDLLDQLM